MSLKRKSLVLKIISLITVYIFYAMYLFQPFVWAASFEDTVTAGSNMGTGLMDTYKPSASTNSSGVVPQYDDAVTQKSTYTDYYTNPSGMSAGATSEARQTVLDSEASRANMDMSNDPIFGYNCLEKDASGNCTKWSLSQDVVANTYADCETIVTTIYDDPETEKTCSGTHSSYDRTCTMMNYPSLTQETVSTPCNTFQIDSQPGQIYARCRDVYQWYRVPAGTWYGLDDCWCGNHGSYACTTPSTEYLAETPPAGATKFSTQYETIACYPVSGSWDNAESNLFDWYYTYKHSRIERVFVIEDSTCLDFDQVTTDGTCTVEEMIQCDPNGNNCITSISNSEDTGEVPVTESYWKSPSGSGSLSCIDAGCQYSLSFSGDEIDFVLEGCPTDEWCVTGTCPATVINNASPSYGQYLGTSRLLSTDTSSCEEFTGSATIGYQDYNHYKNSFSCAVYPGEIDNYDICLNYDSTTVQDSHGGPYVITETAQPSWWSVPYTLRGFDTASWSEVTTTPYYVNHSYLIGGQPVRDYRNVWQMMATLNCNQTTDDCQSLVDEGCYYYSSTCVDEYCTDRTYTYKCGGTGEIQSYEKTYVCAGDVRCMGTECTEVIDVESASFGDAAAAAEIINNIRIDTSGDDIFPGLPYSCQDSPKNCCDENVGGVSISDYIEATAALYKVGTAGMETLAPEMYAAMQDAVASVMPDMGITATENGIMATGEDILVNVTTTAMNACGVAVTEGAVATAIGAVASVIWVLAVLYAIYTILNFAYKVMFSCDNDDMETSVKLTLKLCHYVGQTSEKVLGLTVKTRNVYCCFNSILARLIQEQGKEQLGMGWGTGDSPNCNGFSAGDISNMDFSVMDLTEYMQYVQEKSTLTTEEQAEALNKAMSTVQSTTTYSVPAATTP